MTDGSGVVRWSADYKPFGEATIDQTVSTITNNLRFPGQYYDAETGLNYNYYRDYNPVIGRYIESDPLGIARSRNHLYVYVSNNPLRFKDPLGLMLDGPDIDDPGQLVPGVGPTCLSALREAASLASQVHRGIIGDKRGHCLAHCKVKKGCGQGIEATGDLLSWLMGYGKETYDKVYGWVLGGRSWDDADIDANERGRTCPKDKSCEERCKDLWR
jgi:RHS repeat-associated protein